MAACSVAMPSYTYAMKAERLLRSRGFICQVKRSENTDPAGCGYSLKINGGCKEALAILDNYSVPYTDISNGGV